MRYLGRNTLVVLLLSAVFLVGCRTKGPGESRQTYDGIVLTYYKMDDDTEVMDPLINEFEASYPGLRVNYRKFSDYQEYEKLILSEMAEGEGPDVFSMPNSWFYSNYKKLTPLPENLGSVDEFSQVFVDTAYSDLVRLDDEEIERVYAFPMTVDSLALYYNKAHFEDRIPERGRPASTWDGLKQDIVDLDKEYAFAMGVSDNINLAVDALYLLLLQNEVVIYDEEFEEAVFASVGGAPVLRFLLEFADRSERFFAWDSNAGTNRYGGNEIEAFAAGEVSMILGYSQTYDEILNYADLLGPRGIDVIERSDIRVAPVPQQTADSETTSKRITYAKYYAEGVSRNTEYPELAWELLFHLTSPESLESYFDSTGRPTSRRDLINSQTAHPVYGVFASQVGFAESFPIFDLQKYEEAFSNAIEQGSLGGAQNAINSLISN